MTEEQKAAYIIAMAQCANAEVAGMQAANWARAAIGEKPMYLQSDFERVINKYGIHHNAIITFFGRLDMKIINYIAGLAIVALATFITVE